MVGQRKKIVIAGASGLVGGAALARFGKRDDWDVVAISRRPPLMPLGNATHVSIDLGIQKTALALRTSLAMRRMSFTRL